MSHELNEILDKLDEIGCEIINIERILKNETNKGIEIIADNQRDLLLRLAGE